jgi:hypothetical protein
MIYYILGVIAAFFVGCIAAQLTQKDPEVVAEYKEYHTFEKYAKASEDLMKKLPHDHPYRLTLLLDSAAVLAAYKRMPAVRLLPGTTYLYNLISRHYEKDFSQIDLSFMRLRNVRRQAIIAIRNIYGERT